MNKNLVIEELTSKQNEHWRKIETFYTEAVQKMYSLRQLFDLKQTPVFRDHIPMQEWAAIDRHIDLICELEKFKQEIKAHKRASKAADNIEDPEVSDEMPTRDEAPPWEIGGEPCVTLFNT